MRILYTNCILQGWWSSYHSSYNTEIIVVGMCDGIHYIFLYPDSSQLDSFSLQLAVSLSEMFGPIASVQTYQRSVTVWFTSSPVVSVQDLGEVTGY